MRLFKHLLRGFDRGWWIGHALSREDGKLNGAIKRGWHVVALIAIRGWNSNKDGEKDKVGGLIR